jgi:putative thioredoxin
MSSATDLPRATTAAAFPADVIAASHTTPVLVDFWAAWCGPCRTLGPLLDSVARRLAGRLHVIKVDTEAEQELAARFRIQSIPAVMLFRDGRVVDQFVGVRPEAAIIDWLQPWLPPVVADLATLEAALNSDPDDQERRVALVRLHLDAGRIEDARRHWQLLSDGTRLAQSALAARLFFATEASGLPPGTADLDALYAAGLAAAAAGRYARAAEDFLTLAARSRAYRDDAGRQALLRVFAAAEHDEALVREYRRKLAQLLH